MILHYLTHEEQILIGGFVHHPNCDIVGECKERSLSEFKSYLSKDHYLRKLYSDDEFVEILELKDDREFYIIHSESDDIYISKWDQASSLYCDQVGVVKERTLTELKSYLPAHSWVTKVFTDEELTKKLKLVNPPAKKKLHVVRAWTDGSCYAKAKIGGFGVYMETEINGKTHELRYYKAYSNTKIGRMELSGIIGAMELIEESKRATTKLYIQCDSQYAVNCIAKKWLWRWKQQYGNLKDRTNGDLLQKMYDLYNSFPEGHVHVSWVRGHEDNEGNIEADRLAGLAYKSGEYEVDVY